MQVESPTDPEFVACDGAKARLNLLEKKLLALGVRGKPMFSELSYFKCVLPLLQLPRPA